MRPLSRSPSRPLEAKLDRLRLVLGMSQMAGATVAVILLIAQVCITLTVPLLVAEAIFALRSMRSQYVYRVLFVIPMVVPGIVMLLVWGGMQLGDHWLELKHNLRGLDYLIAAVILLGVGLFVWRHVRRR